jgi:hypothetical protein
MFHGPRISLRIKALLIMATLSMLIEGFVGISLKYRKPALRSYSQIVQQQPRKGWFSVNDGYLDLTQSVLPANAAERGYYVPLHRTGDDNSNLSILVYITDKDLVNKIDSFNSSMNRPITDWGKNHSDLLPQSAPTPTIPMQVSGMIDQKLAQGTDEYAQMQASLKTTQDFLTINLDETPSKLIPIILLIFGSLVGLVAMWTLIMNPKIRPFGKTTDETWVNYNARLGAVTPE